MVIDRRKKSFVKKALFNDHKGCHYLDVTKTLNNFDSFAAIFKHSWPHFVIGRLSSPNLRWERCTENCQNCQ